MDINNDIPIIFYLISIVNIFCKLLKAFLQYKARHFTVIYYTAGISIYADQLHNFIHKVALNAI